MKKTDEGITLKSLAEYTRAEALRPNSRTRLAVETKYGLRECHISLEDAATFSMDFWAGFVAGGIAKLRRTEKEVAR